MQVVYFEQLLHPDLLSMEDLSCRSKYSFTRINLTRAQVINQLDDFLTLAAYIGVLFGLTTKRFDNGEAKALAGDRAR